MRRSSKQSDRQPSGWRRGLAALLIFLLLILFGATLMVGVSGKEDQLPLLRALIFLDVTIPAVIYGFLLITRHR